MSRRCGSRGGRYMSDEKQRIDANVDIVSTELKHNNPLNGDFWVFGLLFLSFGARRGL